MAVRDDDRFQLQDPLKTMSDSLEVSGLCASPVGSSGRANSVHIPRTAVDSSNT